MRIAALNMHHTLAMTRFAICTVTRREPRRSESTRRVAFQFLVGAFESRISEVDVCIEDANGPRGGIDKQCVIAALRGRSNTRSRGHWTQPRTWQSIAPPSASGPCSCGR